MAEELTVDGLRAAIRRGGGTGATPDDARFEMLGRRYERAVQQLIKQIHQVVARVPELEVVLEDEVEEFTSPAFPGKTMEIHDQRLRLTCGDEMLLFDPTARALLSALGQVEIESTRPIPFMIERVLYLIPDRDGRSARWGYRSAANVAGPLAPFGEQDLLRLLHAVFAAD